MAKRDKSEVNAALKEAVYTPEQVIALEQANDNVRMYHSEVARYLGSRDTAIFLAQVRHWWRWSERVRGKGTPFYKYIGECDSASDGDSWYEELGMGRVEFDNVKKRVATRVRGAKQAKALLEVGSELEHIIVYYIPSKGAPIWFFNEDLYLKLRFTAMEAKCLIPALGQMLDSDILYSETLSEELKEKEKEKTYKKEKEKPSAGALEWEAEESTIVEVNPKRAENKAAANKSKSPTQLKAIAAKKKGKPKVMSLDFSLDGATILKAQADGYELTYIQGGFQEFKHFYTIIASGVERSNWNSEFLGKWLIERDRRLGKNGKSRKNANTERLDRLQELTRADLFDTTDIDELADRAYKAIYGANEESSYA